MNKGRKAISILGAAALLLFTCTAGSFAAAAYTGGQSAPEINFSDLNQASWAQKNIIRMRIRGIVAGYSDNTFRPNAEVKQAEAVVMAARELGLEQRAAELGESPGLTLPREFGSGVPAWAEGYVAVAWEQGLIKPEENNFRWNGAANRAWMAQLVVRMMGMEGQATQDSGLQLDFTDDAGIPAWARGYIAVAVEKGIFVGYQDGSFKPGSAVTRAEAATILAKCEKYMSLDDVLEATVDDINKDNIIVYDANDNLYRVYLADGGWIYSGNDTVEFDKLAEGDRVTVIFTGTGTAGFIDILGEGTGEEEGAGEEDEDSSTVSGQVVDVDEGRDEIRIEDEDGDRTTYDVDSDADIIIDGHSSGHDLGDVNTGDRVELQVENGDAVRIEVLSEYDVKGEVIKVDIDLDEIRIEDEDGDRTTYDVDSDAEVIIGGDSGYELDDISEGDEVELRVEDGDVTRIEVLSDEEDTEYYVSGKVVDIDTGYRHIRIEDEDGGTATYDVDSDADIIIDGDSGHELSYINEGDEVEIYIEDDVATSVEVISAVAFIVGELEEVDTDYNIITVTDRDGDEKIYEVDTGADIATPADSRAGLGDLDTGKPVKLEIDDGKIISIVQGTKKVGTIISVDDSDNTMDVELSTGSDRTYDISSDVIIEYGNSRMEIDDLEEDDVVDLYLFDNEVYLIEITSRG